MCFQQREKLLSRKYFFQIKNVVLYVYFSNFGKRKCVKLGSRDAEFKKLQTIFLQQKIEINLYFPYFVTEVSHMAQQIAINYCNFNNNNNNNNKKKK